VVTLVLRSLRSADTRTSLCVVWGYGLVGEPAPSAGSTCFA